MSDTAQQVKEKVDIADFIRAYVPLTPAGKNLKGNCPFHKEKTPSFIVSPDRQMWHCFGCSLGGDIFAFLMRYENIEFFEALKVLAEKAGIEVAKSFGPDQRALNALYDANRLAKEFYKAYLRSTQPAPQKACDYLQSRGLKPETVLEFEIGLAPEHPESLTKFLLGKGFPIQTIEKAGLTVKTERGTYRDRFRERVMFPLFNQFGKVVAFTGRIVPWVNSENLGKYVNSPETQIFNKSKLLYGLDKSKNAIRDSKTAVLVEGQMDFIMSWQDGVRNLVATSGTALTSEHLKSLRRMAETLILSFDQDAAGKMAAERTIDLANAADFSIKVLLPPADSKAKDPADIVQANPGMMAKLVSESRSALEYLLDHYQLDNKSDTLAWKKNIRLILGRVRALASAVDRSNWLKQISDRSGIDQPSLEQEMLDMKTEVPKITEDEIPDKTKSQQFSRRELISQRIVSLAMNSRPLLEAMKGHSADLQ